MTDFDLNLHAQVVERCDDLKALYAERNTMFDDMVDMYLLKWADEDKVKKRGANIKYTLSPDARNTLLGAIRLLIATDPVFSVPYDKNDIDAQRKSEKLEKAASQIWQSAGRARGEPVHYDAVLSMLLFSEMHLAVTRTSDLVEYAKGSKNRVAQMRAEEVASITPYLFDVWDPRTGYPEIDALGLTAFYREVETTVGSIQDQFGEAGFELFPAGTKRYNKVTLCHFWDYENRYSWVRGRTPPLLQEKHGLPFIPVTVALGEGSRLFANMEEQRQPFLYSLWKSGLWNRQNLSLTVLYTMLFAIGSNPQFVYVRNSPDKHLEVDWDVIGGIAHLDAGEQLAPLGKLVIDPSMVQGLEIANEKTNESTIYPQTLGAPIGSNAPFSMVALLHQAGRLPLLVPQKKAGWGIADAVKIALRWMKEETIPGGYQGVLKELKASDIPNSFELEAKLDIALPQDRLQGANVANILTQGESPLVSQRWAREEVLNVGQSADMQREIWGEKAGNLRAMQYFAQQIAQLQAMMQQAMNPQQQQQQMGPPPPDGMGPEMPPPTEQPGLQGGLPPEMMQGGMQGPEMPGQGMPMMEGGQ